MFKTYLAFVKKEALHILRDRRTLLILFGLPIAQVLVFGYAVTNEFRNASIAIVDEARDEASEELVRQFTASGHFILRDEPTSVRELQDLFRAGDVKMGVVIAPDFARDFLDGRAGRVQLLADGSDPNYATTLINYGSQIVQQFQGRYARGRDGHRVNVETQLVYNPTLVSAYNFIPGVIGIILLLISAMMTSLTIAREKELGTMDLLLVSPLNPLLIILGKVTPYVVLAMVDAVMIIVMGYFVFAVPILGSLWLLLGLCALYVLTSLSLGILISTRSADQQTAMMGSLFSLLMPSMLLSGFIFPVDGMPWILQRLSSIIPTTYFIEMVKGVMLRGIGVSSVTSGVGVLCLMTGVLLTLALINFKVRTK